MQNILIVEDNLNQRKLYEREFKKVGINAICAIGQSIDEMIRSGIESAKTQPLSVVVLDLDLRDLKNVPREKGPLLLLGGIEVYIGLRDGGAITEKTQKVICSRHVEAGLRHVQPGDDAYIVRLFALLERIPFRNIITPMSLGGVDQVVEKVIELLGGSQGQSVP